MSNIFLTLTLFFNSLKITGLKSEPYAFREHGDPLYWLRTNPLALPGEKISNQFLNVLADLKIFYH